MRYYNLVVTQPSASGQSATTVLQYTNYPNGSYDPGALNIQFDWVTAPYGTPMGAATVTVEGVNQQTLTNAQSFVGMNFQLSGGFGSQSLPLANPQQAGLLLQGVVRQCFGNWVGTQIDLTFIVYANNNDQDNPANIVLNWIAGVPLATALQQCLAIAYPGVPRTINISNIVQNHTEVHYCSTLSGLAAFIDSITPTNVQIAPKGGGIIVYDNTFKPTQKTLVFTDFIGQPMWIDKGEIQIFLQLRSDISMGDQLLMPQGFQNSPNFVQNTQAAWPSAINYKSAMQGQFTVSQVRQIGNLRAPDGRQWMTVVNAYAQNIQTQPNADLA